jgi:uncharacterized repeat protein (TIGR03803 family)
MEVLMPPKKSSLVNHWIRTIAFLLSSAAALPGFAQTFSIIHRFTGNAGAGNPAFQLVQDAAGNLYGTTSWGGAVRSCEGSGCGGVYRLSPNGNGGWTYTELYNFQFGAEPYNLILDSAGNLYGTSAAGGPSGAGLVFELSPTTTGPWTFTTLYAFTGGSDGSLPNGYLVFDAEGNLYGTTAYGGNSENLGTVFELSPQAGGSWTEQVLWDFNFTSNAGYNPSAGVVFDAQGNLYGTTSGDQAIGTYGTVYKLTKGASGWEATLLHEFKSSGDGGIPEAPVAIDAAGNLYGTTIIGGNAQGSSGTGTVYELSPNGSGGYAFGVLHDFGKTGQSYYPVVLDSSGNLIGVADGGRTNPPGFVFKLTHSGTSWSYSVLHGFDGNNGFQPNTVMIDPSGNIYGVTNAGGIAGCANDSGCGTIFEIAAAAN